MKELLQFRSLFRLSSTYKILYICWECFLNDLLTVIRPVWLKSAETTQAWRNPNNDGADMGAWCMAPIRSMSLNAMPRPTPTKPIEI